jgi:hypothetical protein
MFTYIYIKDFSRGEFQIKTYQPSRRTAVNKNGRNEIQPGSHCLLIAYPDDEVLRKYNEAEHSKLHMKFGGKATELQGFSVKRQGGEYYRMG